MTSQSNQVNQIDLGEIASSHDRRPKERADAAANRTLIMATAQKLFAESGVVAVTMADIAQAAQVGKGTLYRRFDNKGALCLALMESQLIAFQNVMLDRLRAMRHANVTPSNQLKQFLDALIYFTAENMPYLCEVNRGGIRAGDHTAPYFWLHLTVRGLVTESVRVGEMPASTNPAIVADIILGAINANRIRFMTEERGATLADISAGIQALLV
jgi:AcrR family transcriptional regulator